MKLYTIEIDGVPLTGKVYQKIGGPVLGLTVGNPSTYLFDMRTRQYYITKNPRSGQWDMGCVNTNTKQKRGREWDPSTLFTLEAAKDAIAQWRERVVPRRHDYGLANKQPFVVRPKIILKKHVIQEAT